MDKEPYLYSFLEHDNPVTEILEQEAESRDDIQPFVERETARLISLLIRVTKAKRVLELGTGIGYSTVWLGEAVRATGGTVTTVDNHQRTGVEARETVEKSGLEEHVILLQGDAEELIPMMVARGDAYDLIFQDCGKYLYPLLYDDVYQLLKPGGILVSDDTLFRVDASVRKGLGRYIDEYNKRLFADSRYYSTLLPAGHGVAVSYKV